MSQYHPHIHNYCYYCSYKILFIEYTVSMERQAVAKRIAQFKGRVVAVGLGRTNIH